MKLIHLSDLHIGKRVNEVSMIEEQAYILNQILETIDAEQPGAVLIAGDVYDLSGDNRYTDKFTYYSGKGDGYIMDKDGKFYDVYKAEFLGIKGELEFEYFDGGDDLFSAQFIIDSKDFELYGEYEKAVNKTYKYFNKVLSDYQIWDTSDDEGINISWTRSTDKYAYSMYNTQTSDTGFTDDLSDCTVFQFNKYPSEEKLD